MRCHAYQIPSEAYRGLEAQILEMLRDGERQQLLYLLSDHDLSVELLSGEWRALFDAAADHYQVVDDERGIARMVVGPDELAGFVSQLRAQMNGGAWDPISFGLAELVDALPSDCDLVGVVFVEESDDWQWAEPVSEIVAIRPEVFALIGDHARRLLQAQHHACVARLCEDHAEGTIEFTAEQWAKLVGQAREVVPELVGVLEGRLSGEADYTGIREALMRIADPSVQPSLDAWLRVHAAAAQYALYFRDASGEPNAAQGAPVTATGT